MLSRRVWYIKKSLPEKKNCNSSHATGRRFEDGTVDFLSVIAVGHGLDAIHTLAGPMRVVSERTFALAAYLFDRMNGTLHGNGRPVFRTYADTAYRSGNEQGGVVNFNVLRANGEYVGYNEVSVRPGQWYHLVETGAPWAFVPALSMV